MKRVASQLAVSIIVPLFCAFVLTTDTSATGGKAAPGGLAVAVESQLSPGAKSPEGKKTSTSASDALGAITIPEVAAAVGLLILALHNRIRRPEVFRIGK